MSRCASGKVEWFAQEAGRALLRDKSVYVEEDVAVGEFGGVALYYIVLADDFIYQEEIKVLKYCQSLPKGEKGFLAMRFALA